MKFDAKKNGQKSLVGTAEAVIGGIGANVLGNVAPSNIKKFVPIGAVVLGVVAQMFDNEHVKNIGLGLATMGAVNSVSEYIAPKVPAVAMALPPLNSAVAGLGNLEQVYEEMPVLGYDDFDEELQGLEEDYDDELNGGFRRSIDRARNTARLHSNCLTGFENI